MIVVVHPDKDELLALQDSQNKYYSSVAAADILRRDGLISVRSVAASEFEEPVTPETYFLTRDTRIDAESLAKMRKAGVAFEGPLSPLVMQELDLKGETVECASIALRSGSDAWTLRRPQVSMGTESRNVQHPNKWGGANIRVQLFKGKFVDTTFEMELPDGRKFPAIFRHNNTWICALPIFDLVAEHFSVPPLLERMNTRVRMSRMNELVGAVVGDLVKHFVTVSESLLVFCDRWPRPFRAAFTVRHDYDRPIGDRSLNALLDVYDRLGVKCSIGFLAYSTPQDQIREFVRRGHEVQIHAFEADQATLAANVQRLGEIAGTPIVGVSVHGGTTSIGFRGDMHYDWFERAGLTYAECFSFDGYPAPIYRPDAFGLLRRSNLMGTMMHLSMDASTRADDHRLSWMQQRVPQGFDEGQCVIGMNHPDIHRPELLALLDGLSLDGVWIATLGNVVEWERATKYGVNVRSDGRNVFLEYDKPLPEDATIRVQRGKYDIRKSAVAKGTTACSIDSEGRAENGLLPVKPMRKPAAAKTAAIVQQEQARASNRWTLRKTAGRLRDRARLAKRAASRLKSSAIQIVSGNSYSIDAAVISRSAAQSAADSVTAAVRAPAKILLQRGAQDTTSLDLTTLISEPKDWPAYQPVLGASIINDLPPTLSVALGVIAQAHAPERKPALAGTSKSHPVLTKPSLAGEALAKWLISEIENEGINGDGLHREEIPYFLGSTGIRTMGLLRVIAQLGKPAMGTIVDHGACFGLMPWLVAADSGCGVERAVLIDPLVRYEAPMRRLWQHFYGKTTAEWHAKNSEEYVYDRPADLILFCHTLFRLPRDARQSVLARAWRALAPGGLLIVNETVTNQAPAIARGPDILQIDTLVETMSWEEKPNLFRIESGWQQKEPPLSRTASEYGSTSFLVATKPAAVPISEENSGRNAAALANV